MLYENPRGIGCNRCHGEDGSEQILGYTLQKDKKVPFVVPSIQNLSYKEFARSLNEEKESKSVMPTYFLTPNEITTLYNYIQEKSKEKKR